MVTSPISTSKIPATVLIIDDMVNNIAVLEYFLKRAGYQVKVAQSGEEGINSAQKFLPDLILLDVMMPEIDGYEVCSRLKSEAATQEIPIIFVSALSETEDKLKGFRVGAADYVTKPLRYEEVVARVETHIKLSKQQIQLQEQNRQLEKLKEQLLERTAQLETANQTLKRLSNLDGLTQIANRRRLNEYLAESWGCALDQQRPISFIITDIDYFKLYNDTYGHQAGDDCLYQVAQAIQSVVREGSDLAARYGGEEFAVVLPRANTTTALQIALAIRHSIDKLAIPHKNSPVHQYITLSLGVSSVIPEVGTGIRACAMVMAADKALYQAKAQGRNRIVVRAVEPMNCK